MNDLFWCNLCILCLLIMKVISCIWKSKNRDCIKNKTTSSSLLWISCIVTKKIVLWKLFTTIGLNIFKINSNEGTFNVSRREKIDNIGISSLVTF